jgi:hypothetical protein
MHGVYGLHGMAQRLDRKEIDGHAEVLTKGVSMPGEFGRDAETDDDNESVSLHGFQQVN